jgi:hypothetical protein
MKTVKGCLILVILSVSSPTKAQDTDSLFRDPENLTFNDSLSIFRLIDSLMNLQAGAPSSQLAVRLSYNSNVLWAGRTLGIDHFGLAPGLSYYHKTGLFADISGYWSKDFEPTYYLTIFSGGYMHVFSPRFSIIASYDHYLYNLEDEYIPFNNAITISPYVDLKAVTFRLDYSFYFGERTVHRLMPSLGLNLRKKGLLGIDKVSFTPGVYMLLGNETVTEISIPSNRQEWVAAYLRMRQGLPWYIIRSQDVFGIMNYSFMVPVHITHKNWNISLSYAYNIPKALPGETLTLSESGFLAASLTYFIDLKSKKSSL